MAVKRLFDRSRRKRGTILVLSLWLILLLSVMAYSLAYEMRIGMKMTILGQKRLKALALARVGLAKAVMDLRNDRLLGQSNPALASDSTEDVWAQNDDKTDIEYGEGTYSVRLHDEERKLNLNNITPQSVPALRYLLEEVCRFNKKQAQTIANAILDFKDPDSKSIEEVNIDESEFYTKWGWDNFGRDLPAGWVFRPKNDRFLSLDELLEIPGITSEVLYGDPRRKTPDPLESEENDKEPSTALADYLTVNGLGHINVNTCSPVTLAALLSGISGGMVDPKDAVKQIDKIRQNPLKIKEQGNDLAARLKALPLPPPFSNWFDQINSTICPLQVYSSTFSIISRGTYMGVPKTIEALVDIRLNVTQIPLGEHRERSRKNQKDRKADGVLKNQPNTIFDPEIHLIHMTEI